MGIFEDTRKGLLESLEIEKGRSIYETDGEYLICPIIEADRDNYVELKRQINGEKTLFLNPYCKDIMWEQVLQGKDKVFSILDNKGEYCGSIELQNPSGKTPEIGIDLLENKRNKGIAVKVVKTLAKKAYEDRKVEYFLIRISSRNAHSKHVFEKMGAIFIGEEESQFDAFMKYFKYIIGERDISDIEEGLREYFGETEDVEPETVYRYKLPPEVFQM